ncbi:VWA domain-containing protein [Labrenzia sp. OB1]|uniref:nitric oxide reductase activation protein NorD n=1 Tax=Labrenzia sp. OB1 TaxID=1561204 RepID=UPI0007B2FE46|nr:VWA domain-containing protein [Labrenzia sp. OB1]KZM50441.1 NorD nitric oxide reductase activation protein [Labrenzia sp. OB1]
MIRPLDLMEPEETVGNLWHDWASRMASSEGYRDCAVPLEAVRVSLAVLFRALGGAGGVEIGASAATASRHRRGTLHTIGDTRQLEYLASFDGDRLRLPPVMDVFPAADLNRAAYLWLAAMAACGEILPPSGASTDPLAEDLRHLLAMQAATARVLAACPGLVSLHVALRAHLLETRVSHATGSTETLVEELTRWHLGDPGLPGAPAGDLMRRYRAGMLQAPRGYAPPVPVPIWLRLEPAQAGKAAADPEAGTAPPGLATTTRKIGIREDREEANRKDSFIIHRFEAILSWVESMNLNRSVDDDDQDNAQKAAEDQDHITLSQNNMRAATRLRLHLDLAPQDADHERLSDHSTYPEWNHRARAYLPDHCRVLEAEASADAEQGIVADPRLVARVRRQFETPHPRRILRPRQIEGAELDLDALIAAQVSLRATGAGSDRIYQSLRVTERDLSVAVLMDCSRSTEAVIGERSVIDTAREALVALAGGIDAAGDRFGIWGFSSLRRDRVFLTRCKRFDAAMSAAVTARIGNLRPGHYTRLGAAVRHVSAQLATEAATRKLLLVLTDGKPNDLDHYEGVYGIEDSRMAVREARMQGQAVHAIIIDADGQDWFARIFNRAGFTLLPDPARLTRALPDIYRSLIQET